MWLLRGLSFTCKALQIAQANTTEELYAAFTKAYEGTLKKFHNFVVKGIFSVSSPIPFPRLFFPLPSRYRSRCVPSRPSWIPRPVLPPRPDLGRTLLDSHGC